MKHRELIDPRNYITSFVDAKKDKDVYWDLPDGDTELRIDIRADFPFRLYLRAGDDQTEFIIPLGTSDHHSHQMRIRDIKGVYAQFDHPTNVAANIRHKSIRIHETPWGDPVVKVVDPEDEIDIRSLIAREMAYLRDDLTEADQHEFEGLEDEEFRAFDDADEDFGEGLMEPPDDVTRSAYERLQRKPRNRRMGSNDPDTTVSVADDEDPGRADWEDSDPPDRDNAGPNEAPAKVSLKQQIKKVIDRY